MSSSFAQMQGVPDTVAYLRDSIQAKRTDFINQPLSKLLNALKINIVSANNGIIYSSSLPDTVDLRYTYFDFYPLKKRVLTFHPLPSIRVEYLSVLKVPKRYFRAGNSLGWFDEWNTTQKLFYRDLIISDLQVCGLP